MRSIGLDVHRDFMEVAIAEGGEIRSWPEGGDGSRLARTVCPEPRS